MIRLLLLPLLLFCLPRPAAAQVNAPAFDMAGPGLHVTVKQGSTVLPLSQVPNLAMGDKVSIRVDLPKDQSAKYLLVAAFLRGATNPPPKNWFYRAETWKAGKNQLSITVPEGAQHAVLFLAPHTGGGFETLRSAVQGRPGAFVRASQDLHQASLDRSRLDAFLAAMPALPGANSARQEAETNLLARSLGVRFNSECLGRQPELQAACLSRAANSLVLHDGRGTSFADTLTGAPTDLAYRLAATPEAGRGYYSPYIGLVRDVARILGAFRTAQYNYIPALTVHTPARTALLLNAVPSFYKPQSVLVTTLPPIEPTKAPVLRPAEPDALQCLTREGLVLPIEGSPLIYSTAFGRDLKLRVRGKDGRLADVPLVSDPSRGGFVLGRSEARLSDLGEDVEASLYGRWGFAEFDGPRFRLQNATKEAWKLSGKQDPALIVGRENKIEVSGPAACVAGVTMTNASGLNQRIEWKVLGPRSLALTLPLAGADPGEVVLTMAQQGLSERTSLKLKAFSEPSRLDAFTIHAGDSVGALAGARLDQVAGLSIGQIKFRPAELTRVQQADRLTLAGEGTREAGALRAGETVTATVAFKDGRSANLKVRVATPRPVLTLIGKEVSRPATQSPVRLTLSDGDALPSDALLTFSLRTGKNSRFTGREVVEIATESGTASATLKAGAELILQDQETLIARLEPARALGPTAFGPLRFRMVQDGVQSDWQPLTTLVRLPKLQGWTCKEQEQACTLSGLDLFFIEAVSPAPDFQNASTVPPGYTSTELNVPISSKGVIYLRLRDDRNVIAAIRPARETHPSNATAPR